MAGLPISDKEKAMCERAVNPVLLPLTKRVKGTKIKVDKEKNIKRS